jgi:hypothetical protein
VIVARAERAQVGREPRGDLGVAREHAAESTI